VGFESESDLRLEKPGFYTFPMSRPDDSDWDMDASEEDWGEDYGDEEDDSDSPTTMCPKCGADMYQDAVRCPLCGEYVTRVHHVWEGKPLWWKLVGLAGILAIILSTLLAIDW